MSEPTYDDPGRKNFSKVRLNAAIGTDDYDILTLRKGATSFFVFCVLLRFTFKFHFQKMKTMKNEIF